MTDNDTTNINNNITDTALSTDTIKKIEDYLCKEDNRDRFYTKEELAVIINIVFNANIHPAQVYNIIYSKLNITSDNKTYAKQTKIENKDRVVYNIDLLYILCLNIESRINAVKEKLLSPAWYNMQVPILSTKEIFSQLSGQFNEDKYIKLSIINDINFAEQRYNLIINLLLKTQKEELNRKTNIFNNKIISLEQQIDDYNHLVKKLVDKLELITYEIGKCAGYLDYFNENKIIEHHYTPNHSNEHFPKDENDSITDRPRQRQYWRYGDNRRPRHTPFTLVEDDAEKNS